MEPSPGLSFIAHSLSRLFVPCTIGYAALSVTNRLFGVSPSRWLIVFLSLLPPLAYWILKPYVDEYRNAREARSRGAAVAPRVNLSGSQVAKTLVDNLNNGYPGAAFQKWCEEYGTAYRLTVGMEEQYFTCEPEHIKTILATEFESFELGPGVFARFKSLLGSGVFSTDGDMWKFHRSITRPFFSRERIIHFDMFDRHTELALRQAKARLDEGYPIDFQDLVSRFTLDSATEFLFKYDVNSLGAGLPYPSPPSHLAKPNSASFDNHPSNVFVKAFTSALNLVAVRIQLGSIWPLGEIMGDKVLPFRKTMDKFVDPFLEEGLKRKAAKEKEKRVERKGDNNHQEDGGTLLDHLVEQTSDEQIIKDELVNLLVASRDTTAALITFSLYMLIEHPEMMKRLREEILSRVGTKSRPTYDDIREMKYLKAFLNEVLRLYPIAPMNGRSSTKGVVLSPPAGSGTPVYIPPGKRIIYSVLVMQRRTDLWGPDALEFDPDRFLDDRLQKYLVHNSFIFAPFNAGPRICLGQQFAYHEASFFLIRLLQRFSSFSLTPEAQPPDSIPPKDWAGHAGPQGKDKIWPAAHLAMYVKGGLWVKMKEASEDD